MPSNLTDSILFVNQQIYNITYIDLITENHYKYSGVHSDMPTFRHFSRRYHLFSSEISLRYHGKITENFLKNDGNSSEKWLKYHWDITEKSLRIFWKITEKSLKNHWKITEKSRKNHWIILCDFGTKQWTFEMARQ